MLECGRVSRPLFIMMVGCLAGMVAGAAENLPRELEGVGIQERLGQSVPAALPFRDQEGREVSLGTYLNQGKPIILTLNYSSCPMLCHLQLNGLVEALKQLKWTPGKEFEVVTISLDPLETVQRAKQTQAKYVEQYERPAVAAGWHFLTGQEANIKAVADSVGFGYRYNPDTKEYLHAAAVMMLSPQGVTARYLYGIQYEPKTVRLALVEAGEGKVGSSVDQLILYCFHYDSAKGKYAPAAYRLMQVGGALTLAVLGAVLLAFWCREVRRRNAPETKA